MSVKTVTDTASVTHRICPIAGWAYKSCFNTEIYMKQIHVCKEVIQRKIARMLPPNYSVFRYLSNIDLSK